MLKQRPGDVEARYGQRCLALWYEPSSPSMADAQAIARAKLEALKPVPRKKRAVPMRPGALAASGERVLSRPDAEHSGSAKKIVRIYYRSSADEILCFDAGPMSLHAAEALCLEYQHITRSSIYRGKPTDAIDAEILSLHALHAGHEASKHGARRVVLPSQMANSSERAEGDGVAHCDAEP